MATVQELFQGGTGFNSLMEFERHDSDDSLWRQLGMDLTRLESNASWKYNFVSAATQPSVDLKHGLPSPQMMPQNGSVLPTGNFADVHANKDTSAAPSSAYTQEAGNSSSSALSFLPASMAGAGVPTMTPSPFQLCQEAEGAGDGLLPVPPLNVQPIATLSSIDNLHLASSRLAPLTAPMNSRTSRSGKHGPASRVRAQEDPGTPDPEGLATSNSRGLRPRGAAQPSKDADELPARPVTRAIATRSVPRRKYKEAVSISKSQSVSSSGTSDGSLPDFSGSDSGTDSADSDMTPARRGKAAKAGGKVQKRVNPKTGKRPVGRPLIHTGDPNTPGLSKQERRRLKRRIANRESARRTRQRRQDALEEAEAELTRITTEHNALLKNAERQEAELRRAAEDARHWKEKWCQAAAEKVVLYQEIFALQGGAPRPT